MIFKPTNLKVNYTEPKYAIANTEKPVFTWGAERQAPGGRQNSYRIVASCLGETLWDSGFILSSEQRAVYDGIKLPEGAVIDWTLQITDDEENLSQVAQSTFKTACFSELQGKWIESSSEDAHEVQYFVRNFEIDTLPKRAVLYYCGLGLSKAYLNNRETDNYRLAPAHTNYQKESFYVTTPLDISAFSVGENELEIAVAGGWRTNYGPYLDNMSESRKIEFMGKKCLWAQLVLYFEDGKKTVISTDTDWKARTGKITYSHLFNGETYDETSEYSDFCETIVSAFTPNKFSAGYIEPVTVKREVKPVAEYYLGNTKIYDFGENLSGVLRIKAKGNAKNVRFIMRHSEEVSSTGELFCDTLRSAKAEDAYICKDGECNIDFSPTFTYHGFRYASLEVSGEFEGEIEVSMLVFYTDLDTDSYFKCGNQVVNEFYNVVMRTERDNIHSVATDCPQRDERMAWMNDATVRFMSMQYNLSVAKLYEKITADVTNEQDELGRFTCTAPFVYGEQPSDPVCSAGIISAYENYRITGDTSVIEKHYEDFKAWNNYLKSRAEDGCVDYSYYGDWAGPADCCYSVATIGDSDVLKTEEYDTGAAYSVYIPGEMVSTAAYYMNLQIMADISRILGNGEENKHLLEANRVKTAFLDKWFDKETAKVGKGTQGTQALALFMDLIPCEYKEKAAKIMADEVKNDGYRLKTANIVTPMLFDMLSEYGYEDISWKLLTTCDYPSFGYMMANGATTMWERFELKKECGMNSHNHPMYGASVGYLYRQLAGFKVITPNKEYRLRPRMPKDLPYFEMKIPTLSGSIYLKCERKYGEFNIFVDVPFGISISLNTSGKNYTLEHGFHVINLREGENK